MKDLVAAGKIIIFGTDDPQGVLSRGKAPIGKGQCPLCHKFFPEQRSRGPILFAGSTTDQTRLNSALIDVPDPALSFSVEERSHLRIREERYKIALNRHDMGEPNSGIIPHAKSGGEYLIESLYCPNCYVALGWGLKGTDDAVSPMPRIHRNPTSLTDLEIVAVVAYLQSKETPGDYSKVTVLKDWENYFRTKLTIPSTLNLTSRNTKSEGIDRIGQAKDKDEEKIKKMVCFACHKIPGIFIAKTGMIGPLLIMKTNAKNRLESAEYQKAVKQGRAHATTPKEYVVESILDPGAFIVPGFADGMVKDYGHKMTVKGLEKLADFLLKQGEDEARREGLDRLANEKEGSLYN